MNWNIICYQFYIVGQFSFIFLLRIVRICFIMSILAFAILGVQKFIFAQKPMDKLINPLVRWYVWGVLWIGLFFGRSKLFSLSWEPWQAITDAVHMLEGNAYVKGVYFGVLALILLTQYRKNYGIKKYIKGLPQFCDQDSVWEMAKGRIWHSVFPCPVRVVVARQELSPLSFGLLRPVIVLPADYQTKYQKEELAYVFYHELNHIYHFDLWVLKGLTILKAVWWFAPWFSYVVKQIKLDMEAICDYRTLLLPETSFYAYGMAILKSVPKSQGGIEMGVALAEKGGAVQKRILEILQFRPFCKAQLWLVRISFLCLVLCSIMFVKNYSFLPYQMIDKIQIMKYQMEPEELLSAEEIQGIVTVENDVICIQGERLYQILQEKQIKETEIDIFRIVLEKESEEILLSQGVALKVEEFKGEALIKIPIYDNDMARLETWIWKYI